MKTHKRFIEVYNKYQNNRLTKFWYKHFISDKNYFTTFTLFIQVIFINFILFAGMYIFKHQVKPYFLLILICLSSLAVLLYIITAFVFFANKKREKKIAETLRVTMDEYARLAEIYQMKI